MQWKHGKNRWIFIRISSLASKKRSNQKNKGTFYHKLEDFISTLLHYFFDLTSFYMLGQKYENVFVRFLVQMKTLKSPFEINWPLDLPILHRLQSIFFMPLTSVPTDLVNWGPSGPDWTTKIFRTSPNGPGPDLSEKKCDKMVQKNMPELDYAQCSCMICFWVFVIEFL